MNRFVTVTLEEENRILEGRSAKNTVKEGKIDLNTLMKYCKEKCINVDLIRPKNSVFSANRYSVKKSNRDL